jgi:hypothetical protein
MENGLENWDCPEALDNNSFINHIMSKKNQIFNKDEQIISLNRPEMSMNDIHERFLNDTKTKIGLIEYEFNIVLGNLI